MLSHALFFPRRYGMNKNSKYVLEKDNENIKHNILQITTDVLIFLISLFLIIHNLRNTTFVSIIRPFSLIATIVFVPLFIFNRIITALYFKKILKIYYRGVFLFIIIIPICAMILIINSGIPGIISFFHNNEVWNILLSYYYYLITIYCFGFNLFTSIFPLKHNKSNLNEQQIYQKLYIIYLLALLILPLFINKIFPYSFLIKI